MDEKEIICSGCRVSITKYQKCVRLSRPKTFGSNMVNFYWHHRFVGDCFDQTREKARARIEANKPREMTAFEKFLATREAKGVIQ